MMKHGLIALSVIATCVGVAGCGSGVRTMPAQSEPAKGSFNETIKNNPNIPDSAKKAMLGNNAGAPSH